MIRLSIRARTALLMALSAALSGVLVGTLSLLALYRQAEDNALDRARLLGEAIEPIAVGLVLTPGDPDLELALDGFLEALRRDPDVVRIAVFGDGGQRVPPTDEAEAPAIRGGSLHVVHDGSVLAAHPLTTDGVPVGYLAVELRFPWRGILLDISALALVTGLVVLLGVAAAFVASAPATADLRGILAAIERLGRGDLWTPSGLRKGNDELGRVAVALEDLAQRLDQAAAERATGNPELEQNEQDAAIELELEPVRIAGLVDELAAEVVVGEGVRFEVDAHVSPEHEVLADPRAVRTIVSELLRNAAAHTSAGQITLSAFVDTHGGVTITVQDTGEGLSDLSYRYLFRPVPASDGGFGVGLATAQRYARAMGARLLHDVRYHRGARFELHLPGSHEGMAEGVA